MTSIIEPSHRAELRELLATSPDRAWSAELVTSILDELDAADHGHGMTHAEHDTLTKGYEHAAQQLREAQARLARVDALAEKWRVEGRKPYTVMPLWRAADTLRMTLDGGAA